MKKVNLLFLLLWSATISFAQNVGIGTFSPEYNLHVKNVSGETAIGVNATGTATQAFVNLSIDNRNDGNSLLLLKYRPGVSGTTAGILKSNLSLISADAGAGPLLISTNQNSPMHFATNALERMRIAANGHVGINITNPMSGWLHVENNDNDATIYASNNVLTGQATGILGKISAGFGAAIGGVAADNAGGSSPIEFERYGVLGAVGALGIGVGAYGLQASTAVRAYNINALGYALRTSGKLKLDGIGEAANKILTSDASGNATWQNLPAFTHTATAGNISANVTTLSYANAASSDIVIAVSNYNPNGAGGTYNNHPIGVYWTGSSWSIFNQDVVNMPVGAAFNVMVIKQ